MSELLSSLKELDIAAMLPDIEVFLLQLEKILRIFVMAGPLTILGLGLWYFFSPPKEANHRAGFRTLWGMGSVEAWLFSQKVAGIAFTVTGFVLTVVMALICNGYRDMEPVDAIQSAGVCLLWQAGIVLVVCLSCHLVPLILFDWKGVRRSEKRKNRER